MTSKKQPMALLTFTAIALALGGAGCGKTNEEATEKEMMPEQSVVSEPVAMPGSPVLPETVVTVNGKALKGEDITKELEMMTSSPQFQSLPPQQADMYKKQMQARLIDRFVNQQVLLDEADKEKIAVPEERVDEMLENIRGQLPPGMTVEEILSQRGMTMETLRSDIGRDLRIQTLIEKQFDSIEDPTEEEIAAFYEENKEQFNQPESSHTRHILLKVDPDADEATKTAKKAELEGYRKQIVDGTADFADLAKEHSDCPSGKRGGGDLGTFKRGDMVPEFDKLAFEQEVGVVSPVFETQFGYHILEVLERGEAGQKALEDVSEDISTNLKNGKQQEVVQAYITGLRENATITYGE